MIESSRFSSISGAVLSKTIVQGVSDYLLPALSSAITVRVHVFVKSDLSTTNMIFSVKITYSILTVQRTLENYLKLTDTILNLYNIYLQHGMKPRLYFHSLLPQ